MANGERRMPKLKPRMDTDEHGWEPGRRRANLFRALKRALPLDCVDLSPLSRGDSSPFLSSPNGAVPYQPRAERSAALGWIAKWNPALKGRSMGQAARENGSPLQGFGASPMPTQGDALGWYESAPLGLTRCSSPSIYWNRAWVTERSRLAPAQARGRGRARAEVRRRQVACTKAVTSHRTPNRCAFHGAKKSDSLRAGFHPCLSVSIRGYQISSSPFAFRKLP